MYVEENILHGPAQSVNNFEGYTLGQLLLNQLKIHGYRTAQVDAYVGKEKTFKEILDTSIKLAIYLRKVGLKPNDRVAICSENSIEFCIPVCAAVYLGATVCPLNPLYTEGELKHTLNISRPKYIFVSTIGATVVKKIINQLCWMPKMIMMKDDNVIDNRILNIEQAILDITTNGLENFQACKVDVNDHVAAIMCSSGTTGFPKGVMLTDKNILTVVRLLTDPSIGFLTKDSVTLGLLPFFHSYSFAVFIVTLVIGAKNIILPRFEEKIFLSTIEKYKIQTLTVVPALMVFLAKHPLVDKYNLSSIKTIWCGAAPLSESIQKSVATRLKMLEIKQGYGLTETTLVVLFTPSNSNKYGSAGVLAPGISAKVISIDDNIPSKKALGPHCIGELCFKGDVIMKGYCNDEKSTAATIDENGWLHTGDIGYYDRDGFFYIVDRLKELIKYKGFQVAPAEIEAILLTYSGIKDAAVIGLPNEEVGELPLAFVVRQNECITADEIIAYVNERVSNPKRLRGGVRFVESIPRTPSGKILRRLLRETMMSKL